MFRKIDDFLTAWKHESEVTSKALGTLTDGSLSRSVAGDDRTIAQVAWHIVTTVPHFASRIGLKVAGPAYDAPAPITAEEMKEAYDGAAKSLADAVRASWTDETLLDADEMFGGKWLRGVTLQTLILHQTHHRGQLSVLMRHAGIVLPVMYGPTREARAAMEMQPPAV